MPEETALGGPDVRFQPTAWSVVREAKEGARDAWDRLIGAYWKPVYFFVRRRGHDVESAKDLTQAFFAAALEKDFLKGVRADRGRFRSWLLAALGHFLSNEHDRAKAKKRGGDWNFVAAEAELAAAAPGPEEAYRRTWALEILGRAMDRLRRGTPPEEMAMLSGVFPPALSATDRKNRLHRLRLRLRECLREEILPSVESAAEAESEVREIRAALGD